MLIPSIRLPPPPRAQPGVVLPRTSCQGNLAPLKGKVSQPPRGRADWIAVSHSYRHHATPLRPGPPSGPTAAHSPVTHAGTRLCPSTHAQTTPSPGVRLLPRTPEASVDTEGGGGQFPPPQPIQATTCSPAPHAGNGGGE